MKIYFLLFALIVSGYANEPAVHFDWFEYTGRDDVFALPLPAGHYRNPILAGFYPDPSICRVEGDYYLINSTFAYFPGIPIFHSRDLVNWTQIGHVIDRPGQLNYDGLGVSRGIFAPAISQHKGTFYVVCTMADAGGNFLMTATNPAGPWSDPVWFNFEGIDPSLFFDTNGRAWMINNGAPEGKPLYDGHRAIWIQEFDIAAKRMIGPRSVIVNGGVDLAKKPVWIEGPHLYQKDGWYYLCAAEGGTGDNHSQVILRSKSVTGPFVPWEKNPILTQRDLDGTVSQAVTTTGHADLVIGPDGNWWSIFLGCRPFAGKFYATGRETFLLPVKWTDDGWPQILPPGERVPYVVRSPVVNHAHRVAGVEDPGPGSASKVERADLSELSDVKASVLGATRSTAENTIPLTGNFTWRDDFTGPTLSPLWLMLRQPHETWWHQDNGQLTLTPRSDTVSGKGQPSFFGRRLQHARFETSVALEIPSTTGVSAGLVAFQSETHHYYFAIRRTSEGLQLFLERLSGKGPEIVASAKLPDAKQLKLRLTGEDKVLSFSYATDAGTWATLVPDADATVITTQAAGGFVGALIGLHTRRESR
jgi:xylan 1,4-beta-xylosidase